VRYVLHANFKCSACGADQPRLYEATMDEAKDVPRGRPAAPADRAVMM
jgi:hypothetical protein